MSSPFRFAALLAAASLAAGTCAAEEFRLIRSLSGPSGKVEGSRFVLDEVRSRFVYPQDKSLIVYFEWEGPSGTHVLSASWKQPDGRIGSISPEVKIETTSRQLNSYWTYLLVDGMASGVWTVEVRIDGQPAGSHPFEVVAPERPPAPVEAPVKKPPSLDEIFHSVSRSLVWVYKIDRDGRREDTSLGFVAGPNRIATAFQAVDAATKLQLEFSSGRRIETDELAACSRTGDWALIPADTTEIPALASGDPKQVTVGERLIAFNVENGAPIIGGVDITGRRNLPVFGERIQISPGLAAQAAGGPLLDLWGHAVGMLGGSTTPGSRFGRHSMSVSPGLYSSLNNASAAIPLTALPDRAPGRTFRLAELAASGVLTEPLSGMPEFMYGSTALDVSKKAGDAMPSDVSEFSMRDPQVWVYSLWAQKSKLSKGIVSAKVYDEQNRIRVTVPPKKVSLNATPIRLAFSFPTTALGPGIARIDVTWDDRPVWRTFIRITE